MLGISLPPSLSRTTFTVSNAERPSFTSHHISKPIDTLNIRFQGSQSKKAPELFLTAPELGREFEHAIVLQSPEVRAARLFKQSDEIALKWLANTNFKLHDTNDIPGSTDLESRFRKSSAHHLKRKHNPYGVKIKREPPADNFEVLSRVKGSDARATKYINKLISQQKKYPPSQP